MRLAKLALLIAVAACSPDQNDYWASLGMDAAAPDGGM
jgi:hypothetical protein